MCLKCKFLGLFHRFIKTNKGYWIMTNWFVILHGGKDYHENRKYLFK